MRRVVIRGAVKAIVFIGVLTVVLMVAKMLEGITGIAHEFWLETVCLTHISLNIADDIMGGIKNEDK